MSIEFPRFTACAIVEMAEGSGSGQATTVGRQDKKPHIAAWTVGCFASAFSDFCTSWIVVTMCASLFSRMISVNIAHREFSYDTR